jgi:hypothetical protein
LIGSEVLPWVEKYRPATLDDVVAHQDIISTSAFRLFLASLFSSVWDKGRKKEAGGGGLPC